MYDAAFDGVRGYHKAVLGNIELNHSKILPPPKPILNSHNIHDMLNAILIAYKTSESSDKNVLLYKALKGPFGNIYSVFMDGIQKFCRELNGSFARTVDQDFNIVNIPWALTEIEGGSMNATKLMVEILAVISKIHPISENAS